MIILSFLYPTNDVVVDRFFSLFDQGSENNRFNIANTLIRIKKNQVELDNLEIIEETLVKQTTENTDIEEIGE